MNGALHCKNVALGGGRVKNKVDFWTHLYKGS